jgi:PPP family 3-phenylpropionic acid transporter
LKDVKREDGHLKRNEQAAALAEEASKGNGLKEILLQKEVLWFFGCVLVLATGYRMNEAFLTLSLKGMNAGDEIIGWALLASALSEIPVFFLLSKYGEKFKELPLLAFASLMFTLRFLFMSLAQEPGTVIAIQAMHSVSFGIFFVTAVRYITRIIPDHLRATGQAIFTVVWSSAAGLLSGTFGGIIYENAGRSVFYIVATGFSIVAFAGFLLKHLLDTGGEPRLPFRKRPAIPGVIVTEHIPAPAPAETPAADKPSV